MNFVSILLEVPVTDWIQAISSGVQALFSIVGVVAIIYTALALREQIEANTIQKNSFKWQSRKDKLENAPVFRFAINGKTPVFIGGEMGKNDFLNFKLKNKGKTAYQTEFQIKGVPEKKSLANPDQIRAYSTYFDMVKENEEIEVSIHRKYFSEDFHSLLVFSDMFGHKYQVPVEKQLFGNNYFMTLDNTVEVP